MKKELEYKLVCPIDITVSGQFEKAYQVTLNAPSLNEAKAAWQLEQFVTRALFESAKYQREDVKKEAESQKQEDIKGSDLRKLIMASSVPVDQLFEAFYGCISNVSVIHTSQGEVKLLKSHINKFSLQDVQNMCFDYIAFFTMPSIILETEAPITA